MNWLCIIEKILKNIKAMTDFDIWVYNFEVWLESIPFFKFVCFCFFFLMEYPHFILGLKLEHVLAARPNCYTESPISASLISSGLQAYYISKWMHFIPLLLAFSKIDNAFLLNIPMLSIRTFCGDGNVLDLCYSVATSHRQLLST